MPGRIPGPGYCLTHGRRGETRPHPLPFEDASANAIVLGRSLRQHLSKAALPAMVVVERGVKSRSAEVRPHAIREIQLRVRRLPQQEITEPFFSARANEKVHGS